MNPGTWYVPEGETQQFEVVGVRIGNEEAEPLAFVDGSALLMMVRVLDDDSADDSPRMLKQFGADQLLLAGLHPDHLDPGQVVEIARYEGGGYGVETDPGVDGAADAM